MKAEDFFASVERYKKSLSVEDMKKPVALVIPSPDDYCKNYEGLDPDDFIKLQDIRIAPAQDAVELLLEW